MKSDWNLTETLRSFKLFSNTWRRRGLGLGRGILRMSAHSKLLLEALLRESLDLIDPGFCRECKGVVTHPRDPFCSDCLSRVRWIGSACARCGLPVVQPARAPQGPLHVDSLPPPCGVCRPLRLRFDWASASGLHEGPLRTAVLAFKFCGDLGVLQFLRDSLTRAALASSLEPAMRQAEAIVPVPLHPLKRWWRGLDSGLLLAEELALGLAPRQRLPVLPLLRKQRWTPPQSTLKAAQRRRNLRNGFAVLPGVRVPQVVVLVDDVLTSGSTASECARALKRGGARRVIVVVAARSE